MVEQEKGVNFTITLWIRSINVEVTEQMPVVVIWQRGKKQISTKKRLLNINSQTAEFEEKFQIDTLLEVDADGNPSKSKAVSLFSLLTMIVIIDSGQ